MCLGVRINLAKSVEREITIDNKPGRLEEIKELVSGVVGGSPVGFREALSLRGKIAFAESNLYGRVGAAVGHILADWARSHRRRPATRELKEALARVTLALEVAPARVIRPRGDGPVAVMFLDGAVEDKVTIGGVLVLPGGATEHWGCVVPELITESWKSRADQVQVIGQAEVYPALVARLTWAEHLRGKRVVTFIDNESARIALVKQYSSVLASLRILTCCSAFDAARGVDCWYARVPSDANPADAPSRLDQEELVASGSRCVQPVLPTCLDVQGVETVEPLEYLKMEERGRGSEDVDIRF